MVQRWVDLEMVKQHTGSTAIGLDGTCISSALIMDRAWRKMFLDLHKMGYTRTEIARLTSEPTEFVTKVLTKQATPGMNEQARTNTLTHAAKIGLPHSVSEMENLLREETPFTVARKTLSVGAILGLWGRKGATALTRVGYTREQIAEGTGMDIGKINRRMDKFEKDVYKKLPSILEERDANMVRGVLVKKEKGMGQAGVLGRKTPPDELVKHPVWGKKHTGIVSKGDRTVGGAKRIYEIHDATANYDRERLARIVFQDGNPNKQVNGVNNEDLLVIVLDRLNGFNSGETLPRNQPCHHADRAGPSLVAPAHP